MRRFAFALLLPLIMFLAGCDTLQRDDSGVAQSAVSDTSQSAGASGASLSESPAYRSDTSPENCMLCGGGIENLMPSGWGQNNIALISLNTFEIKPIEINRYDGDRLIEEFAGFSSIGGGRSQDGGFSASLVQDHNRGYARGPVWLYDDAVLDIGNMADFLCENCLNEILPLHPDRCFGVGAINLATKEVRIFAEDLGGFTLGDLYIDCNLKNQDSDEPRMGILVFYCPIRYEKEA